MRECSGEWGRSLALGLIALTLGAVSCTDPKDEAPGDCELGEVSCPAPRDEAPGDCKQEAESAPVVCGLLDRSQPSPAGAGVCSGEWCWANALPQGQHLYSVWSPSPGVAWMVGARGTALRVEGTRVELKPAHTRADLLEVWGSSETALWAVGVQGTLLRWNGTAWSETAGLTRGHLRALWGTSATNVWAGGDSGYLARWDGVSWAQVSLGTASTILDLWAATADDLWVATEAGVRRCGAGGCQPFLGPQGAGVEFAPGRIQGLSAQDVYFLERHPPGSQVSRVHRWNQGTWTKVPEYASPGEVYDFAVVAPDDVGLAVRTSTFVGPRVIPGFSMLRWNGSDWVAAAGVSLKGPLYALWRSGSGDMWAVGWAGEILRADAQGWRSLTSELPLLAPSGAVRHPSLETNEAIGDLLGLPGGGVAGTLGTSRFWEAGPGDIWTASLVTTTVPPLPSAPTTRLSVARYSQNMARSVLSIEGHGSQLGIHGSSASNVWVATRAGLHRYDGAEWSQPVVLDPQTYQLTGPLWVFGPNDVWVGGINGLFHWSCGTFTQVRREGFSVTGLWGASKDDLWAVGTREGKGEAWHWDGKEWTQAVLPAVAEEVGLVALAGRCSDELYAVGSARTVLRWDGTAWSALGLPFHLGRLTGAARVGAELWVTGEGVTPFVQEPSLATPAYRRNILRHPW